MNKDTSTFQGHNCVCNLHKISSRDFSNVYWLGGSPCSGKSSITEILANEYNLQRYHVDEAFQQHIDDFTKEMYPMNWKWTHTPWEQLWAQPSQILFEQAVIAYSEHLRFVFEDLEHIPGKVIVEGTSLLPDCIKPLLIDDSQALWMVPTDYFQRTTYPIRGPFVSQIMNQCRDPEQALTNWMDRDVAFARWIEQRTASLDLTCIMVDGATSIAENAAFVSDYFHLV